MFQQLTKEQKRILKWRSRMKRAVTSILRKNPQMTNFEARQRAYQKVGRMP